MRLRQIYEGIYYGHAPGHKVDYSKYHFYVDLDGVLSDLAVGISQYTPISGNNWKTPRILDRAIQNKMNATKQTDRKAATRELFAELPKTRAADALWSHLCKVSNRPPIILTSVLKGFEGAADGKYEWALNLNPTPSDIITVDHNDKGRFASRDDGEFNVLIDDSDHNIKAWTENGGLAIKHTGDVRNTIEQINHIGSQAHLVLDMDNPLGVTTSLQIPKKSGSNVFRLNRDTYRISRRTYKTFVNSTGPNGVTTPETVQFDTIAVFETDSSSSDILKQFKSSDLSQYEQLPRLLETVSSAVIGWLKTTDFGKDKPITIAMPESSSKLASYLADALSNEIMTRLAPQVQVIECPKVSNPAQIVFNPQGAASAASVWSSYASDSKKRKLNPFRQNPTNKRSIADYQWTEQDVLNLWHREAVNNMMSNNGKLKVKDLDRFSRMNIYGLCSLPNEAVVEGTDCLIVDDFTTFGSTITSIAKELLEHGANKVVGVAMWRFGSK